MTLMWTLLTTCNTQRKLGMLKELTTKSSGEFIDYEQLARTTKEGMALLELTYSTSGISPPRKGQGVFLTLDPLPFTAFYYGKALRSALNVYRHLTFIMDMQMSACSATIRQWTTAVWAVSRHATTCCAH